MEKDDRGPYFETLGLETILSGLRFLPAIFPAAVIGGVVGVPLLLMTGGEEWGPVLPGILWLAAFLAFSPVIASVLTLTVLPGGYGLTRWELGAREPSVRERTELLEALQELTETASSGTIEPSRWLVIDAIDPNALVVGTTIYVHRGLFRTPYFLPVLAHELGHLNHGDGRLVLALRRLVPPPLSYLSFEEGSYLPWLLKLFGGGLGLTLMTPAWNRYWQKRELLADRFAFECGQADGLIEFLETYQFFDVAVPFHTFTSTHPYSETRIDNLQDLLEEEDTLAEPAGTGPIRKSEEPQAKRKRGYTDTEAVLDMVILDEAHAGWTADETVAAERAWMNANGRRILTNAYSGHDTRGRGVVLMLLSGDPSDWLSGSKFNYMRQSEHAKYLHSTTSVVMQEIDPAMRAEWEQRVADYDPERTMIGLIVSFDHRTGREGVSYYQLSPAGGGALADRVMELIPQE